MAATGIHPAALTRRGGGEDDRVATVASVVADAKEIAKKFSQDSANLDRSQALTRIGKADQQRIMAERAVSKLDKLVPMIQKAHRSLGDGAWDHNLVAAIDIARQTIKSVRNRIEDVAQLPDADPVALLANGRITAASARAKGVKLS